MSVWGSLLRDPKPQIANTMGNKSQRWASAERPAGRLHTAGPDLMACLSGLLRPRKAFLTSPRPPWSGRCHLTTPRPARDGEVSHTCLSEWLGHVSSHVQREDGTVEALFYFFYSFAWLESDVCDEHGAMGAAWSSSRDSRQATRSDLRDTHTHLLPSLTQAGPGGPRAEIGLDFFITGHVRTMGPRDGEKSEHVVCFESIRDIAGRGDSGRWGEEEKKSLFCS